MVVILEEFPQDSERLHRQLACRREDDDAGAVPGHELELEDQLDSRDEEGQCFAGTGLGGADKVAALE